MYRSWCGGERDWYLESDRAATRRERRTDSDGLRKGKERKKKKGRKKERHGESGDVCLMGKSKKKGGLRGWWGKERERKKKK